MDLATAFSLFGNPESTKQILVGETERVADGYNATQGLAKNRLLREGTWRSLCLASIKDLPGPGTGGTGKKPKAGTSSKHPRLKRSEVFVRLSTHRVTHAVKRESGDVKIDPETDVDIHLRVSFGRWRKVKRLI